ELQQSPLAETIGAEAADWAQALVDAASLAGEREDLVLGQRELAGRGLQVLCSRLVLEEELGVLTLEAVGVAPAGAAGGAGDASAAVPAEASGSDQRADAFRLHLVELMQTSLDAWERLTRRTRVDLAQDSGVWRVTVDDGRLRTRAMDRYLRL